MFKFSKKTAKQEGFSQKETTENLVIFQRDRGKKTIENENGTLIVSTCDKIIFPLNADEEDVFVFKKQKKEFKKKLAGNVLQLCARFNGA